MGINAVKGVEIGAGFAAVAQKGTEHGDEMTPQGFPSNHAGGIPGGISDRADVVVVDRDQADVEHPARRTIDLAGNRSMSTRTAATTPASASARRRSPRRCWRWC